MARKRSRKRGPSLIAGHLSGIQRALLEGEKRAAFLEFLDKELPVKQGIYSLYDKRGRLYYSGKASDLPRRLNQHLKDRHSEGWDRMTLYHVSDSANVGELEGLVVATARPPGNKQSRRLVSTFENGYGNIFGRMLFFRSTRRFILIARIRRIRFLGE